MIGNLKGTLSKETLLSEEEPLCAMTTMKVGGIARYYAEPATKEDLCELMRSASVAGLPVFFMGRGSNVIAVDGVVDCLVIRLRHPNWRRIEMTGDRHLRVGAGLRLRELCVYASKQGVEGFEFLEGIPGTVGGALRMNAGAMGAWIFQLVEQVRLVTRDGDEKVVDREDLNFGYRQCAELREACAVEAVLCGTGVGDMAVIRERILAFQQRRYATQPKEPSAGCMFKNPECGAAGRLIDELGLKGASCGDAQVSEIHGNFIINKGNASFADVLALVRRVRGEVLRKAGVMLEPEVVLLGAKWGDLL